MSSPYHDVTPYLTAAGTVGTTTHVRQFHGVYPGIVISNTDPLNQNRITMYVPQFLGTAQSGWAMPMIGIMVAPQPGELVYASFMGGDVSQPVYINASQKQLNATALQPGVVPTITFSATQPANGMQGDLWYDTSMGSALSQFQNGAWVPYQYGTEAIAASAITSQEIATGALDAKSINAPSITAGTLTVATILNAPFPANSQTSIQGSQISLSSAGGIAPTGTNPGGSMLIYQTAPTSQTFNGLAGLREDQREYGSRYGNTVGTFTVPAGVTSISVQMWGGGGGGDVNCHGGGGGEYIHEPYYQVTPLSVLSYSVGSGGVGGGGAIGSQISTTGGNVSTLTGGNVQAKPTSLIAYGGAGAGSSGQSVNAPIYGGGVSITHQSPDHGENPGGNAGYNSVFESSFNFSQQEYQNFNTSLVAPGGGGGAGGPTGPGGSGPVIATGSGTSGAGGLGNSPGGSGGQADALSYDSLGGDYFSSGHDGIAPGGGGSGGWNGANAQYNVFAGNGAGGQIVLNWQGGAGAQMIGSIAASSGVDNAATPNSYPAGFAGQSFQLADQINAPFQPTGASLLYGAGGRPYAHSPTGITLQVPGPSGTGMPLACSDIKYTGTTVTATGASLPLSYAIPIPANDSATGSCYKMTAFGYGSTDGVSLVSFDALFGGVLAFSGVSPGVEPTPSGNEFAWDVTITILSLSPSSNAAVFTSYLSGNLAVVNQGANAFNSVIASLPNAGFAVDTTTASTFQLYGGISPAGSSTITCIATVFERTGA